MSRDKFQAAEQATERFINKRLRVNKPFQSLLTTDEFESFHVKIKKAIAGQYKAVADMLSEAQSVAVSTDQLLEKFVETHMPPLSDYLTADEIYDYLRYCFVEGVRAQYGRFGLKTSVKKVDFEFDDDGFELTNQDLIDALKSEADYLLNQSNIDATTKQRLIDLVKGEKLDNATIDEIANAITDEMPEISDSRAFTIARTETSRAMGEGNYNGMVQNGVQTKQWVAAGSSACDICDENVDDGFINIDDSFSSGDDYEPAHPNCECYTEAGEIDLDSIDVWDGS